MPESIIYVDQSEIRDGAFEELKAAMTELAEFVDANEPQILAYNVYFSEDRTRMTVLHLHADPDSLEAHMRVAGPMFPPIGEFITLKAIDVYGRPSEDLVKRLKGKAEMLGSGAVGLHDLHAGFARLAAV